MYKFDENSIEETLLASKKKSEERLDLALCLGELLSSQKRHKVYVQKGYKTFKEFLEAEFNLPSGHVNVLISNYELYVENLDMDEMRFKTIGIDKLDLIKPFVKSANYTEAEDWLKNAEDHSLSQLREEINNLREKQRRANLTLKDILIDQWLEKMVTFFNCGRKELNFKLALWFQDRDLEPIRDEIRDRQRKFEEEEIKTVLEGEK